MREKSLVLGLLIWGLIFISAEIHASAGEVLVVAYSDVPVERLDQGSVKEIFLGDVLKWENSEMVALVVCEGSEVHKEFLKKYINRTENQFRNVWRQNLFTGKGKIPKKVNSIEELLDYVSKTKGSIGYAPAGTTLPAGVKVLSK